MSTVSRNLLFTWTKDYEDQVMGLQFSLWTERVADEKRLDFMTFPALSLLPKMAGHLPRQKNAVSL